MGQAPQPSEPAIYGRYQTLFRIAAGGMAEVYAARVRGEAGFQKLVALKRMLPHLTDDERFVNMFMDEGKLAANIESPNVVSTLDLGRADDGSLYLVMELVVGTTLSTLLRNVAKDGELCPIDVACEILAQAAQGLHDAHEAKTPFGAPLQLVHRDISPQNILVGTDGRVRITDFGVARAVLRRTKTSTGEFKGKLSYFSPEQCADRNLDRRSDLFSLGVVAWETLTTRRLFHAENPLAVLERVTRMPIPSAHTVRPEVPEAVAEVVAKALQRDRNERFDTALEFGQALRAAAQEAVGAGDRSQIGRAHV
jgi:eukaryotic-like serine/threonine-protein kinase